MQGLWLHSAIGTAGRRRLESGGDRPRSRGRTRRRGRTGRHLLAGSGERGRCHPDPRGLFGFSRTEVHRPGSAVGCGRRWGEAARADAGQKRAEPCGTTADRATAILTEEHAGEFAALVEDRPTRVALSGPSRELHELLRIARARREILGAAAGLGAIGAAAIAGDREQIARCRGRGRKRNGRGWRLPDDECRKVPCLIPANNGAGGLETVGELHEHGRSAVTDDMPVGEHDRLFAVGIDEHARSKRGTGLLRGHDPHHGRVRRLPAEQVVGEDFRLPVRGIGARLRRRAKTPRQLSLNR